MKSISMLIGKSKYGSLDIYRIFNVNQEELNYIHGKFRHMMTSFNMRNEDGIFRMIRGS